MNITASLPDMEELVNFYNTQNKVLITFFFVSAKTKLLLTNQRLKLFLASNVA